MKKERLVAFTDAVLAIIMTILVLELPKPAEPTIEAILNLQESFFAYTLSFFWLAALWYGMHGIWELAEKISNKVILLNILLLFFSSLIPYTTSLVSKNFNSSVMQGLYGIIVLLVSLTNVALHKAIDGPNRYNQKLLMITKQFRISLFYDILIKATGLIVTITMYPQAMMISVFISMTYITIIRVIIVIKEKLN